MSSTTPIRRIDALTREKLKTISTATVATLMFKRGLRNQFMQGVFRLTKHSKPMVGQAFTVRHIAAREDIDVSPIFRELDHPQRVAIESIPDGDIMVMDCRGDASAASLGGILATRLEVRGCAGFVSDAGVRDTDYISNLDMPAYVASRSAPTNLTKHHATDINVPVTCGKVPVYPGDVILGDGDGVMVIPLEILDDLIPEALRMEHFEIFITELVRGGRSVIGTYPANDETLALYEEYKKTHPFQFGE
jgi:regulator of RNase E activity RraA